MGIIWLSAAPLVLALVLWAFADLPRFVVYGLLAAMIFPASLIQPGGTNIAAADLLLLVVFAAWLIRNSLGATPGAWVRGNRILVPACAFIFVSLVSALWSDNTRQTIQFAVQVTEITILFPIVFASLPTSTQQIRRGLWIVAVLTAGLAVYGLATYSSDAAAATSGTYLPGFNKNALGSVVGAGLVISYALWTGEARTRLRLVLLGAMALQIGGLIASGSRGSMLGAAAAALFIGWLAGNRRLLAVFLAATLAALYLAVIAPAQTVKTTSGGYNSSVIRTNAWKDAVKKIEHDPWFGTGAATYSDTLSFPAGFYTPDPLNLFLLTWAELGIPGMLALCFLLYRMASVILAGRRLEPEARVLVIGLGGVAVSFLVHFQVDVSWVRGETTIEFAAVGLAQAVLRLASAERVAPGTEVAGPSVETRIPTPA